MKPAKGLSTRPTLPRSLFLTFLTPLTTQCLPKSADRLNATRMSTDRQTDRRCNLPFLNSTRRRPSVRRTHLSATVLDTVDSSWQRPPAAYLANNLPLCPLAPIWAVTTAPPHLHVSLSLQGPLAAIQFVSCLAFSALANCLTQKKYALHLSVIPCFSLSLFLNCLFIRSSTRIQEFYNLVVMYVTVLRKF